MGSNYQAGHDAEKRGALYLRRQGFQILQLNWRTRYCEVDIVAQKNRRLYFIEVKARRSQAWGDGLDYITPQKLRRMRFAAELWVYRYGWSGEFQLAGLGVQGNQYDFVLIEGV